MRSPVCLLGAVCISELTLWGTKRTVECLNSVKSLRHVRVFSGEEQLSAQKGTALLQNSVGLCCDSLTGISYSTQLWGLLWWSSGCSHLPMQGTWVQSLVWENPACCGAMKPMHHNYCVCVPQQDKPPQLAWAPQLESSLCSPQLEKACMQQWRPSTAKNKLINFKKALSTIESIGS